MPIAMTVLVRMRVVMMEESPLLDLALNKRVLRLWLKMGCEEEKKLPFEACTLLLRRFSSSIPMGLL